MDVVGIRKLIDFLGVETPPSFVPINGWITMPCPFSEVTHSRGLDRHPSFGIKINKTGLSSYHCFSCKQKGKLFQLPDAYARIVLDDFAGNPQGLSYAMSLETESLVNGPDEVEIIRNYNQYKDTPLGDSAIQGLFLPVAQVPRALEYLQSRGVNAATAESLGLLFDEQEVRILFPVRMPDGVLYGVTSRTILAPEIIANSLTKYPKVKNYFHFNKSNYLLGAERLTNKPVLVVEGLMGYASLISQGVEDRVNVVALMGSSLSKAQAEILIHNSQAVYLMLDNDEAGLIGMFGNGSTRGAVGLLYNHLPVYVPQWPDGKIDPDQLTSKDIDLILQNTYPYVYATG